MIINLTQHTPTAEQAAAGVYEPVSDKSEIINLLTFDTLPSQDDILEAAGSLARIAAEYCAEAAMIGGAPYLMGPLERALRERGITPLYAFTIRQSVEETLPDGSVKKYSVFKHAGFVEGAL